MTGIAVGNDTWFKYITETVENTSPITGVVYPVAIVSESLKYSRSKSASSSINSHGQVDSLIRGTSSASGGSVHELRYGEFDTFFESAFRKAWASDVLLVGTLDKSFSFERGFPLMTTPAYELFSGVKCDGFNLSVPSDSRKVDITFNWFGYKEKAPVPTTDWVATNAGVTLGVNPAASKPPMYMLCANLKIDSTEVATVTGFNLNFSKGLAPIDVVDCDDPTAVVAGSLLSVDGTMDMVFTDMATHNDFLADTEFTLEFTLTDGTSTYLVEMDAVEFSDSGNPITGPTQVTRNQSFIAKYDSTLTYTIRLTRAAS